jgi:hypothetical protein
MNERYLHSLLPSMIAVYFLPFFTDFDKKNSTIDVVDEHDILLQIVNGCGERKVVQKKYERAGKEYLPY